MNKRFNLKYFQLSILTLAAGIIYSLPYLRQTYQQAIIDGNGITPQQFANAVSYYGAMLAISNLLSGIVSDKFAPKMLLVFSLISSGLLGFWYATFPGYTGVVIIHVGWGITTILTFWSASIKIIRMIADNNEQGRFFGILEGGRGLVEALVGSIALWIFTAYITDTDTKFGVQLVLSFYSFGNIIIGIFVLILFPADKARDNKKEKQYSIIETIKIVLLSPPVWIMSLIIAAGYTMFLGMFDLTVFLKISLCLEQHKLLCLEQLDYGLDL